jgi:hypothetical protein
MSNRRCPICPMHTRMFKLHARSLRLVACHWIGRLIAPKIRGWRVAVIPNRHLCIYFMAGRASMVRVASNKTMSRNNGKKSENGTLDREAKLPLRYKPINPGLFIANRSRLSKMLLPNSLAVVNSNDVPLTNADGAPQ